MPRFTPSRMPLLDQRWTAVPPDAPQFQIVDAGAVLPTGSQTGVRWSHIGDAVRVLAVVLRRLQPSAEHRRRAPASRSAVRSSVVDDRIRRFASYGADAAMPTRWFTVKGEAAYFTSSSPATDEYVLYVVQLERQTGEWVFVGGYAGEAVTERRAALTFAPDRGLTRSIVGARVVHHRSESQRGVRDRGPAEPATACTARRSTRRRAASTGGSTVTGVLHRRRAGRLSRSVSPQLARASLVLRYSF